jgi:hypothetical protein
MSKKYKKLHLQNRFEYKFTFFTQIIHNVGKKSKKILIFNQD